MSHVARVYLVILIWGWGRDSVSDPTHSLIFHFWLQSRTNCSRKCADWHKQTEKKIRHSCTCSVLLVLCWLTAYLSDKTQVQANTHSPHLTDHFPLVLVCQKQQLCLSFHLNPKLTSKVWPLRVQLFWELTVKLKENETWTKFLRGHTPATLTYT